MDDGEKKQELCIGCESLREGEETVVERESVSVEVCCCFLCVLLSLYSYASVGLYKGK